LLIISVKVNKMFIKDYSKKVIMKYKSIIIYDILIIKFNKHYKKNQWLNKNKKYFIDKQIKD